MYKFPLFHLMNPFATHSQSTNHMSSFVWNSCANISTCTQKFCNTISSCLQCLINSWGINEKLKFLGTNLKWVGILNFHAFRFHKYHMLFVICEWSEMGLKSKPQALFVCNSLFLEGNDSLLVGAHETWVHHQTKSTNVDNGTNCMQVTPFC